MVKLGARAAMFFDFVYVRADAASLDYSFQGQDEREHPTLVLHHRLCVCSALLLSSLHSPLQVAACVQRPAPFANAIFCLLLPFALLFLFRASVYARCCFSV